MAENKAMPGQLRLAQFQNDTFPEEMRRAIKNTSVGKKAKWHIELSIRDVAENGPPEPNGVVRFKHNFPKGMREYIKNDLGLDNWCLQMKLIDGDGAGGAGGDDDGTGVGANAPGMMAALGNAKTKLAANSRGKGAKSAASHSRTKKAAPTKTAKRASSRSAAKSPRSASKKRGKR